MVSIQRAQSGTKGTKVNYSTGPASTQKSGGKKGLEISSPPPQLGQRGKAPTSAGLGPRQEQEEAAQGNRGLLGPPGLGGLPFLTPTDPRQTQGNGALVGNGGGGPHSVPAGAFKALAVNACNVSTRGKSQQQNSLRERRPMDQSTPGIHSSNMLDGKTVPRINNQKSFILAAQHQPL